MTPFDVLWISMVAGIGAHAGWNFSRALSTLLGLLIDRIAPRKKWTERRNR